MFFIFFEENEIGSHSHLFEVISSNSFSRLIQPISLLKNTCPFKEFGILCGINVIF